MRGSGQVRLSRRPRPAFLSGIYTVAQKVSLPSGRRGTSTCRESCEHVETERLGFVARRFDFLRDLRLSCEEFVGIIKDMAGWRFAGSNVRESNLRKGSARTRNDELRPEYDLLQLKGGVRGKYYEHAKAGTNLVLIEPDLAGAFPDEESVNRALRLLLTTANTAMGGSRRRRAAPDRRLKRNGKKSGA